MNLKLNVYKWMCIVALLGTFFSCAASNLSKNSQQVSQTSGQISAENAAIKQSLVFLKPNVSTAGTPTLQFATQETDQQSKDITTLETNQAALQASYEARLVADAKDNLKLQTQMANLNGRWYVILGKELAAWKWILIGALVLGIVLKGLSTLPAPYGTICGIIATVVFAVLSAGVTVIENILDALVGKLVTPTVDAQQEIK